MPLALALIFLLLYSTFSSIRLGALIFLSVPLGAIGGVLALWLRGLNFSISAGVGFIALSGVAVLDGLVLVSAIRQLIEEGVAIREAVHEASMSRLRPILMTGPGRQPRVRADGLLPRRRGRGPAPAGHGRHRRPDHQHAPEARRPARHLPLVRSAARPPSDDPDPAKPRADRVETRRWART